MLRMESATFGIQGKIWMAGSKDVRVDNGACS